MEASNKEGSTDAESIQELHRSALRVLFIIFEGILRKEANPFLGILQIRQLLLSKMVGDYPLKSFVVLLKSIKNIFGGIKETQI